MLAYVLERLAAQKGSWREIADASGVPYDTLTKVALGRVEDPRTSTVQKLHDFFRGQEAAA